MIKLPLIQQKCEFESTDNKVLLGHKMTCSKSRDGHSKTGFLACHTRVKLALHRLIRDLGRQIPWANPNLDPKVFQSVWDGKRRSI